MMSIYTAEGSTVRESWLARGESGGRSETPPEVASIPPHVGTSPKKPRPRRDSGKRVHHVSNKKLLDRARGARAPARQS